MSKSSIEKIISGIKNELMTGMTTLNRRKLIIGSIPYIAIFYVADKLHLLFRYCEGSDLFGRIIVLITNIEMAFDPLWPSMNVQDLLAGACGALAFKLILWYRASNSKHFRQGIEYGSARWGNAKDIAPFIDPVYENNILLTATERLTLNGRPKNPVHARNKNVIIIGGSGSGKTRF